MNASFVSLSAKLNQTPAKYSTNRVGNMIGLTLLFLLAIWLMARALKMY
jgi:hypothetical protein